MDSYPLFVCVSPRRTRSKLKSEDSQQKNGLDQQLQDEQTEPPQIPWKDLEQDSESNSEIITIISQESVRSALSEKDSTHRTSDSDANSQDQTDNTHNLSHVLDQLRGDFEEMRQE